ncbi:kinetochore Sim4 complex subunit FTA2-domain-containing protein [Xylariaceae sp. FL0255]|nr:kinetochore Sim4 complex subunit FTA2-domain-containing protein [Xylariaceae sp. FL0255]
MYPEFPETADDLVSLPRCDGPKLKPFDFKGWRKIEFLEYLGSGLHSYILKVSILSKVYALKLFKFAAYDEDWSGGLADEVDRTDHETMSALYNYMDPFSNECRAFGRLQEDGHEDLAVKCYGYLLLDEEQERYLLEHFTDINGARLKFHEGDDSLEDGDPLSRIRCKDARPSPIRCIVKEFGPTDPDLKSSDVRRILREIIQLQQLGIIQIDVAHRQLVGGKLCDFSVAITVPHIITSPELNPRLTPYWVSRMEFEAFQFSISDYWDFDDMINEWNEDEQYDNRRKNKISVLAFPGGNGHIKYNLRSIPARERFFSFVDPRLCEWRSCASDIEDHVNTRKSRQRAKNGRVENPSGVVPKARQRLQAKPPRWFYDCDHETAARLNRGRLRGLSTSLDWEFKDGLIFPATKWGTRRACMEC